MILVLNQELFDAALFFLDSRFPDGADGGCAAMKCASGKILISTKVPNKNERAVLCHETGAIAEAWKLGEKVVASICLSRKNGEKPVVFSPCGLCQERLMVFCNFDFSEASDIEIAVPDPENKCGFLVRKLSELQPYYWRNVKKY